ncbi:MAG: CinA family nicotinamide mononucleotide deamidase-related protein [Thermodesulfobacteriota bacterium]
MEGEIITIGDELISGRVCDLNSCFLSGRISSFGLKIKAVSSVGDDRDQILDVLRRAVARSDFVVVCGGLGPTEDDITTEVAAECFDRRLLFNEGFLETIRGSLNKFGLPWIEGYRKLAYVPEGAELIAPRSACGFVLYHGRIPVFFLPGVPAEVRHITEKTLLPLLLSRNSQNVVVRQRVFKLFGPQEAQIGEALEGLTGGDKRLLVGFYPNFPENHVTVTVRAGSEEEAERLLAAAEAEIERRLGEFVVAKDASTLEESVGRLLREKGLLVAVAESCTGGLIGSRLTSIPGSSNYFERGLVVYSNRSKVELLGIPAHILEKHGAVSEEAALRMARAVRKLSGTDLGLASTGLAGPEGGTPEKPVGTVFIALAGPEGVKAKRYKFAGRRDQITVLTAQTALCWLYLYLSDRSLLDGRPDR